MKSSRTNSFRLHRISRASSVKKHSQTFYVPDETFKLSAINSVTRGIRHNQLSFLVGDNLNKLRNQPTVATDQFYQTAHQCLTDTRKRYDEAKKQRVKADENIIKIKQQIKKYKSIQNQYLEKIQGGKDQVQNMQKSLEAKRMLLEETQMQKKVLLAMRMRLKSDKVVYDQRKFDLGKQYSFQSKQIGILKKDGFFVGQENERAEKVYQKFMTQLSSQNKQRQEHLRNIEAMIEQKQRCNQNNIAREHQINEIAERAMQDKEPTQEQWYRIYLTHVFVSKMLRNKIDREMKKFSVVEFAFKTIKTATGVNDSKTFVKKFLNKQVQYGEMLGRITVNEKKINELKQVRDFLLEQQKQLQMDKQTYEMLKLKNVDISHQIKQYQVISDHERKMETYGSKISSWLNKQAKKLNAIEKSSHLNFNQTRNKQALKQNFIKFCHILSETLSKCQKQQYYDEQTSAGDLSARDSARVARIVPRKTLKNAEGEQVYEIQEEELPHTVQVQQKQIIDAQREDLIKSNERFMKQAKKRLDQRRKINLQRQAEKKKPVQIKKEQV